MKALQLLLLAILIGNFAQAQQKTPEDRANNQAKNLMEKLGLTVNQEKEIYALALKNVRQQDADRVKYQNDKESMMHAIKQNMNNYDAGLSKILTTEQLAKYNQLKEEQRLHHHHHHIGDKNCNK